MPAQKKLAKSFLFWTFSLIFLLIILFLGGLLWWEAGLKPVDVQNKEQVNFVIERGETVAKIANRLKEANLIKDPFRFKLYLFLSGKAKKIQTGFYQFSPSMSVREIFQSLVKGSTGLRVTIVEGLRQEQIGELLAEKGFAINSLEWQKEIVSQKLEGKLFPDTYFFPPQASGGAVLKIINRNFEKKVKEALAQEINQSGLTLEQILILASIVERESRTEEDRRLVAGILLKRWRQNWPLQADATVQYALASNRCKVAGVVCDWWPKSLTKKDLQINSPYNTYLSRELPPTPICNPGLSSIRAVLNPKDSPYWYYLNDENGVMHYAKTDEEQAENIRRYLH